MDFDLKTLVIAVIAIGIVLFVVGLLIRGKKKPVERPGYTSKECHGCGWKGQVSKFHKKCPNCGDTLI